MAMRVQGGRMVPAWGDAQSAQKQAYMAAFGRVSPLMVEAQGAMSELTKAVMQQGVATPQEVRDLSQAEQLLRRFINSIVERNGK